MPEHLLERSQRIEVPIERAFAFYADALNLEPMTPPWLHFQVTRPGEITMEAGALLDYTLRLHGIPVRWQTLIETWEPPHRFVDTQSKGPYALWEHTHTFHADGENATVLGDRVRYRIPFGPLGELAHVLFVKRDLRADLRLQSGGGGRVGAGPGSGLDVDRSVRVEDQRRPKVRPGGHPGHHTPEFRPCSTARYWYSPAESRPSLISRRCLKASSGASSPLPSPVPTGCGSPSGGTYLKA